MGKKAAHSHSKPNAKKSMFYYKNHIEIVYHEMSFEDTWLNLLPWTPLVSNSHSHRSAQGVSGFAKS